MAVLSDPHPVQDERNIRKMAVLSDHHPVQETGGVISLRKKVSDAFSNLSHSRQVTKPAQYAEYKTTELEPGSQTVIRPSDVPVHKQHQEKGSLTRVTKRRGMKRSLHWKTRKSWLYLYLLCLTGNIPYSVGKKQSETFCKQSVQETKFPVTIRTEDGSRYQNFNEFMPCPTNKTVIEGITACFLNNGEMIISWHPNVTYNGILWIEYGNRPAIKANIFKDCIAEQVERPKKQTQDPTTPTIKGTNKSGKNNRSIVAPIILVLLIAVIIFAAINWKKFNTCYEKIISTSKNSAKRAQQVHSDTDITPNEVVLP